MIPGSKRERESRENETGKEEKPVEGCHFTIVAVGARGLILPRYLRIAHVKDATLRGIHLSPSS